TRDRYDIVPGFPPVTQDAVRDAAPRVGRRPLIAFSHGSGGHRRQSTFLTTHLASHGYVVAAVDHAGNTHRDAMQLAVAQRAGMPPPDTAAAVRALAESRPADIRVMLDRVLGDDGVAADADRIGMAGHSMGGWTALLCARRDPRLSALVLLAPGGGAGPGAGRLRGEQLAFDWGRDVPALSLAAERDSLTPLAGVRELLARTRGPARLFVLANGDHYHFCDRVEQVHEMARKLPLAGV